MSTTVTVKKRASSKRLTDSEYRLIKTLTNMKTLTTTKIANVTGRSHATVIHIGRSKDFDDYKAVVKEITTKQAERIAERKALRGKTPQAPTLVPHNLTPDEIQRVDKLTHGGVQPPKEDKTLVTLERIASAMERLADAWEAQPKKKGFLG